MTESPLEFPAKKPWPTVKTYSVGDMSHEILRATLAVTADPHDDPAGFVRQSRKAASLFLPIRLREIMEDFTVYGDGGLLLTDVPVGPSPPTPESATNNITRNTVMAKELSVIVSVIGHLAGYRGESNGELIQALLPTKADRYEQTSTGSCVELLAHTEQAFSEFRPDWLGLGCLRGDPHAVTYLLSARTLVRCLPGQVIRLLCDKEFYTGVDTSFIRGGASADVRGPFAVLSGPLGDPVLRYDGELMYSPSPEHQQALEMVHAVYLEHRSGVALKAGDILVIDNSRGIHGRSPFYAQFDRGDRHICRVQGHASLAATRWVRRLDSPVIEIEGS